MAIQRTDPLRDLHRLQDRMNRLFQDVITQAPGAAALEADGPGSWKPATDLFESPEGYVVQADLPGVEAGDLEVLVEHSRLVLRGERKRGERTYLRAERPDGRFYVQLALPESVDRQRIEASHRNGVLEIVLPKRREDAPGRIEVAGA